MFLSISPWLKKQYTVDNTDTDTFIDFKGDNNIIVMERFL